MQLDDKIKIIEYRKDAVVVITSSHPKEKCILCDEMVGTISTYQSDGIWLWPYDLYHYIEHHNLRIPEKMHNDIKSNNYKPPANIDIPVENLPWPPVD